MLMECCYKWIMMLKSKSEDVVMHFVVDDIYIITTCQMVSYHPLWIHSQCNSKQFLTAVNTTLHVLIYVNLFEDRKFNFNISWGCVVSGILSEISVTGEPLLTQYILCIRYETCHLHVYASCVLYIVSES